MKLNKEQCRWYKRIYLIKNILLFLFLPTLLINVSASDVLVWQGQYYEGTTFNTGTYEFNFTVYDALTGGNVCYSNTTTLTTGNFGEWKTEQSGVNSACNNVSEDYYLNINIDGTDETPRRRLVVWNYLRKDVDETTIGTLQSHSQIVAPVVNATQIVAPIIQANTHMVAPIVNATQIITSNITANETGFFDYLGSLANRIIGLFVQSIDVNNIITKILMIQANNGKNLTIGFDESNNLYINQTAGNGYLQFMNTANNPQIMAGNSGSTGAFYVDMDNHRPIYLNGLEGGDVETGGNLTVGNLLKLATTTLPTCSVDGLIGKNATGIYYCNSTNWRQFQFVN